MDSFSGLKAAPGVGFILVVGGLGYIGSHVSLELLKDGQNVIIIDDLSNSFEHTFSHIKAHAASHCVHQSRPMPEIHFHKLDFRSGRMQKMLEMYTTNGNGREGRTARRSLITGVIHLAGYKSIEESISSPLQYYQNNVCGLVTLLEYLQVHSIHRLIFSSSAAVYGATGDVDGHLREEDIAQNETSNISKATAHPSPGCRPVPTLGSPYARTKLFGEAIIRDIAIADPRWRITALRYFNPLGGVLGHQPRHEVGGLSARLVQILSGQQKVLQVFGDDWPTRDGSPERDFVHVADVARGHIAALHANLSFPFRAINLGSGHGTTVLEIVQCLERHTNQKIPLRLVGRRAGDVGVSVANTDRAERELGWKAHETISQCAVDILRVAARYSTSRDGA